MLVEVRRRVDVPPVGSWWACEHPERPHEFRYTLYHDPGHTECAACVIAAEAALAHGVPLGRYLDAVGEHEEAMGRPVVAGRPWP